MNPLLVLASAILPNVLDLLAGPRAAEATTSIAKTVAAVTGTDDPAAARKAAEDPAIAAQLRIKLAEIVLAEKKAASDAEAQERKDRMEHELAINRSMLERMVAEQKDLQARRDQDFRDTEGARSFVSDIIDKDKYLSRTPMVLSYMVTAGFFIILIAFLVMKNELETPKLAPLSEEVRPILNTLKPEQIAALVQPRSDFVVQIINICVGALAAAFATVMSFWLGSSQSSRTKDAIAANLQERSADTQARQSKENVQLVAAEVARTISQGSSGSAVIDGGATVVPEMKVVAVEVAQPSGEGDMPADRVPEPVRPASIGLLAEVMPGLVQPHRHFPGSVSWALTPSGVAIDGARAQGTAGEPKTVRRIWTNFGPFCAASAKKYGVPVELIVATIATESGGDPNARRAEPQINDVSVGLMQTLVKTARFATARPNLSADDLLDPATSIDAGTAYIASQRSSTHFDPPRVAAAYNAGSLRRDDASANRWRLHCFPRGTGQHVDRFVSWFNDAIRVSDDDDWGKVSGCPAFAETFVGVAPSPRAADTTSPDFPPRPGFRPILSLEDRQRLFGTFQFVHAPVAGNAENIRILGNWESDNIVTVKIPLKTVLGKPGPLSIRFHVAAKDQLTALWLEWEKAGLLDRILTYDGGFVPRFQRGSTTKLSNHAFGSAFDINAASNGLGVEPAEIGEKGCVRELVPIANAHGFYWGGHFNTRPDGMHFEIAKLM